MTKRPGRRESWLISCSLSPSLKYSWDGSPLRLAKGSTAIEGMLGRGNDASGFAGGWIQA